MVNLEAALIEGKGGSALISVGFGGSWEATYVVREVLDGSGRLMAFLE